MAPRPGRRRRRPATALLLAGLALGGVRFAPAQEFEPRTYSPVPVGLNFIALAYGYGKGNVLMDPSLPFEGVKAGSHLAVLRYVRGIRLFDRPAKIKVAQLWSEADWRGTVAGEPRRRQVNGRGDLRLILETIFSGARAMSREEAATTRLGTLWGGRLQVVAPTGQYDRNRLINLGSNRWAFVPEVGFSHPIGRWSLEGALEAWIFTDNSDFFGGSRLEQEPLLTAKLTAVRSIRPGFWWALAGGYGYGARTTVDGQQADNIQRNYRFSVFFAYPFSRRTGISASLSSGGNFGAGADISSFVVGYQVAW